MDLSTQWKRLYALHSRTKHYLLIAEELCEEGDVFLQPLKEHRDAYDHIIRAQGAAFREDLSEAERTAYTEKNMDKAYGHEYRAFFDTADWLSYICRRYIRRTLKAQKSKDISAFEDYENIKILVNDIPLKIAKLREGKDIAIAPKEQEDLVKIGTLAESYCTVLDSLIDAYILVHKRFDKI